MTQPHASLGGRRTIERWCALAEKRLDYLTELFETGRWRRFHTEADFLENIREAKTAVDRWRRLATQEAALDNHAVSWSWLSRGSDTSPLYRSPVLHEELPQCEVESAELEIDPVVVPAQPSSVLQRVMAAMAGQEHQAPDQAVSDDNWQHALDPSVLLDRYPILRNAI